MNEFPKRFDIKREREIYVAWEASRAFHANRDSEKPLFVMPMPPPNATGSLHDGHALTLTIEDLIARWRRMAGYEVLWLPGIDHASIATESAVIRSLQAEGMENPRQTLKRDGLMSRIDKHVAESRATISKQIRALGASCDWERERYTLDDGMKRIVNEMFARMFRDGLIYRGNRIVNWDVSLQTVLSDDEIDDERKPTIIYHVRCGPVDVPTDRPELLLGATGIAVKPGESRYAKLIGNTITVQWPNGQSSCLQVFRDEALLNLGLAIKAVIPAHDPIDFEIAKRHKLPFVSVVGEDGRITAAAPSYKGWPVLECRTAFVKALDEAGLIVSADTQEKKARLSLQGTPVEYVLKRQWFISVDHAAIEWEERTLNLRQVMEDVVQSGKIRFVPEHKGTELLKWIAELRDWCISRQIWLGHQVPVWYRGDNETYVGPHKPEGTGWTQDEDTLDTWFSSALWTWSTLVDSDATKDLSLSLDEILERSPDYQRFHPVTLLETGYDILPFWVGRMILMTTYATHKIPFETVYLHGLVLDKTRKKISTARPDRNDPRRVIEDKEHGGADTLRLALVRGMPTGTDTQLDDSKIVTAHQFITKLWNAGRYVAERAVSENTLPAVVTHAINQWLLNKLAATAAMVTENLGRFEFGNAADLLANAFRSDFDFYIEATKQSALRRLPETQRVLGHAFGFYLRLFHPFIPFVTEDLWSRTGHAGLLMRQPWPDAAPDPDKDGATEEIETLIPLVIWIREWRKTAPIPSGTALLLQIWTTQSRHLLERSATLLSELANVTSVEFVSSEEDGMHEISGGLRGRLRPLNETSTR